jgi:hypothetical protein
MAVAMLAGCGSSLLRQPGVAPGEVTARKATTAQQTRRNLKYAVLYNFKGGASDSAVRRTGAEPYATLINVNGTLYGTTETGGKYVKRVRFQGHTKEHALRCILISLRPAERPVDSAFEESRKGAPCLSSHFGLSES